MQFHHSMVEPKVSITPQKNRPAVVLDNGWFLTREWDAGMDALRARLRAQIQLHEANDRLGDPYPDMKVVLQNRDVRMQACRIGDEKFEYDVMTKSRPVPEVAPAKVARKKCLKRGRRINGSWLMDTGCGHDLVPAELAEGCQ